MGLGIVAGAMQGAGEAGVAAGLQVQKHFGDEELLKMKADADQELAKTHATLAQQTHAANTETDIAAAPRRQAAELPGKVEERKQIAAVDTQAAVDQFTKLEPIKRKAAIDTAVEQLKALTTPDMLKAERQKALATHIVDPSYTLIPNADGTVSTFDVHSGKSTGQVKDADGTPLQRKDPEELKAATSVINMANTNLRIAQAEHKAAMADLSADEPTKARAQAAWKEAQIEAKRLTAPAYAVLYGKAKIEDAGSGDEAKPSIVDPFKKSDKTSDAGAKDDAPKKKKGIVAGAMEEPSPQQKREAELRGEYEAEQAKKGGGLQEFNDNKEKTRLRSEM